VVDSLLPHRDAQALDLFEMCVARYERQIMLTGESGDPDIVFRQWAPLETQRILDPTLLPCRLAIAGKHNIRQHEFVDASDVLIRLA
jgi:hypothetical protein